MKKLLATLVCLGLMSANLACYADIVKDVDISVQKIPLKSSLYKEYNAYQYVIKNEGNDDLNLVNANLNSIDSGIACYGK